MLTIFQLPLAQTILAAFCRELDATWAGVFYALGEAGPGAA